jgi:CRISPR/Cas system CSM-associated protein Csm3 (group 7 of RAMP superfamily)
MARELSTRLTITGKLQTTTPIHVGGIVNNIEEDMPLAKNGLGDFYIPGTSLAGVFRNWMETHFENQQILNTLWGFQEEPAAKKGEKPKGAASRIFIEDAKVTLPTGLSEELWDSVGINRRWGTAAKGQKFDRTVLPKGSQIDLHLQIDLPEKTQAKTIRAMLGHLIKALQNEEITIGAASTRGLGQVKLISSQFQELNWNQSDLLNWLINETITQELNPEEFITNDTNLDLTHPHILRLTIDWKPIGALMTKASYDGIAVDMLPRVTGTEAGEMTLVLPGSGIKGALRSQAERIIRTVLGNQKPLSDDWLEQVQVPLINEMFGSAKQKTENSGKRAAISINTCYAKNINCSITEWQQIENAKKSNTNNPLYSALNKAKLRQKPYLEQGYHVGIDRWTGAAADGYLYTAIEPFGVEWEPIKIRLDLNLLPSELQKPALALLLLLLRDLSANRLPLGFGVNRGYGELEISQVKFKWEQIDTTENQYGLDGISLTNPIYLNKLPSLEKIQTDWREWINAQKEYSND